MANSLVHYTYCLLILIVFIDRGDGRWKKKDRESLQKDIELFKKMTDKIEYEIEAFYDEYPDERLPRNNVDRINIKYAQSTLGHIDASNQIEQHEIKPEMQSHGNNKTDIVFQNLIAQSVPEVLRSKVAEINKIKLNLNVHKPRWPKFDDILLAMGKRYDWKNDRWIKVKRKLKEIGSEKTKDTTHEYHEKHNFFYRIVKLNKSKNRRNVVVAVSAVR